MGNALVVHEVESVEQLPEEVACLGFRETTTKSHKVEELTATNQLENNIVDGFGALLRMSLLACAIFDKSDNVWMVELSEDVDLCLDELLERLVGLHNLDGVACARCIFGKFDFA